MGDLSKKTNILFLSAFFLLGYGVNCAEDYWLSASSVEINSTSSSTNTSEVTETEVTSFPPSEVTEIVLTDEQQQKLEQFREKMLPDLPHYYMKTDDYLLRWLRARDWNNERAEQMLRDNLKWRQEQNMDTIETEDWSDMLADYPYTKDTVDKMGRPVGTINIGPWDIRAASYAGKLPRLLRYSSKMMEEATQGVYTKRARGLNVTQWKVLMNMEGFGLRQHACPSCLSFHQAFVSSYEDHYPGYADAFVLINTPATFRVVLEVIKPFLTGTTQKSIKVFGRNEKVWKKFLDQEIAEDQRRPEFGGNKQDPEDVITNSTQVFNY